MTAALIWYLTITALGWLAFPIAYRLLPALPDRGYSLSRALGLLIWGYLFWLLASLGALHNDAAGLVFAAVLLAGLSLWALLGVTPAVLGDWLRRRARMILAAEVLFALAFGAWCVVRAANPEAIGTEKPMELAFINAILRSPTFPPHDPWLSGYAISYYYFGYVLVAMLAQITGTPGALAFNLGGTLVFGLGAVGAYGIVYNLLNAGRAPSDRPRFTLAALFGPLYLLLVSNWEGFLEVLHNRGLFWQTAPGGAPASAFWRWLDIKDLTLPPASSAATWAPTRYYWWWRASRVVQDYDLAGNPREIIDEFPFFSFLLADLHPHVLAIPFGLLAVGLALNLFLGGGKSSGTPRRVRLSAERLVALAVAAGGVGLLLTGLGLWKLRLSLALVGLLLAALGGAAYAWGSERRTFPEPWLEFELPLRPAVFGLCALALGGMAFLNTWDYPLYVALAAAAFALSEHRPGAGALKRLAGRFVGLGLALGISGILLYLPFYLSFSSQAGGLIPNLIYPTRGAHLWVMFGPLLVPILAFLVFSARRTRPDGVLTTGLKLALGLFLALWLASLGLGLLAANLPGSLGEISQIFKASIAAQDTRTLFVASVLRRLTQPGGWITLLALAAGGIAILARNGRPPATDDPMTVADEPLSVVGDLSSARNRLSPVFPFVSLLILGGTLMVAGPEFFFLRDLFGSRMNTIFKFYYQAWLVWSLAAAYATVILLDGLQGGTRAVVGLLLGLSLAAGLVYPPFSLWNKTNSFNPPEWTLDSTAYLARSNPAEMQALDWLRQAPAGVVAEAGKGDAYSDYGRAATLSGQPGVLGWINHENQWRGAGSGAAIGTRPADLKQLYCTRSWEEARAVLERYHIRYILVGGLERAAYPLNSAACPLGLVEAKFVRNLPTAFQAGDVSIYEYSGNATANPTP